MRIIIKFCFVFFHKISLAFFCPGFCSRIAAQAKQDIERSNLSILDPEKIQELREFFKACHTSVNNVHVFSFPALFLTEIRNNILPLLQDVQKRIQTLNIENQTKVRELIESIQSTKQQPSIKSHIEKIEEVKRMLKSLARDDKPTI